MHGQTQDIPDPQSVACFDPSLTHSDRLKDASVVEVVARSKICCGRIGWVDSQVADVNSRPETQREASIRRRPSGALIPTAVEPPSATGSIENEPIFVYTHGQRVDRYPRQAAHLPGGMVYLKGNGQE